MSNLIKHAKRELKLAGLFNKDSDYGGLLAKSVIELIELFSKQGHSGFSAKRTIGLFSTIADFKPLTMITGKDEEWHEVHGTLRQNNRCSSIFKDGNKAYYLNAIVWKGSKPGDTFTGTIQGITSRQAIKFPFSPKTFTISVVLDGEGNYMIENVTDLDKVFEYYIKTDEYSTLNK